MIKREITPLLQTKKVEPYSKEVLEAEFGRIDKAWRDFQNNRDRNAVYGYLDAVFQAVVVWKSWGWIEYFVRPALAARNGRSGTVDAFAAVIGCTSDRGKVPAKTASKWSRAMRYAEIRKPALEPLDEFIKRKGGINACAARYTRWRRRHLGGR